MATSNIDKQSFGQAGATYLKTTGDIEGQFCAITIIADTSFTTLTWNELNKSRGGSGWISSTAPSVAGETLTNADAIGSGDVFPAGITIYGEFTKIGIAAGGIILAYNAA